MNDMFPLFVPSFPYYSLIHDVVTYLAIPAAIGLVLLVVFRRYISKVALFLGAIGVSQIILSAFAYFPSSTLNVFPNEVSIGLFILTGGVLLAAFDVVRTKKNRRLGSVMFIVLACIELVFFIDFAISFPDFAAWNVWINATPALSFLMAGVVTLICGVLSHFLGRTKAKQDVHLQRA